MEDKFVYWNNQQRILEQKLNLIYYVKDLSNSGITDLISEVKEEIKQAVEAKYFYAGREEN